MKPAFNPINVCFKSSPPHSSIHALTLGRLSLHPPAHNQALFKGCLFDYRWLAYGTFQLLTWWPCCLNWARNGCQKEDNNLLQHSQLATKVTFGNLLSVHNGDQTAQWTESLWAFPESYTVHDSRVGCSSSVGPRADKRPQRHQGQFLCNYCAFESVNNGTMV